MIKSLRLGNINIEENIIKDVSNHFRLKKIKKETNNATIKSTSKAIKYKIIRDIGIFLSMKKKIIVNQ